MIRLTLLSDSTRLVRQRACTSERAAVVRLTQRFKDRVNEEGCGGVPGR